MKKVYEADNYFALMEARCRAARAFDRQGDEERYEDLARAVRNGQKLSIFAAQAYLAERMGMENGHVGMRLEAATRHELPERWRDIVVMLIILIRQVFDNCQEC